MTQAYNNKDSSLEDKLRIYLEQLDSRGIGFMEPEIEAIKQIFADEGYVYAPRVEKYDSDFMAGKQVMAGQEWYDRFEENIESEDWPTLPLSDKKVLTHAEVMEAAKRASGIM